MYKNNTQMNQILKKLEDIDEKLERPTSVNDYISERDAKKLLARGTTWFWEQRKMGLPFFKLGAEVYYMKIDLITLMKTN
jgi:hypothetical protein|tara:strand:- start:240 stop:479 length:240 start_codon:yes stop_codon:yes gene_type:complete